MRDFKINRLNNYICKMKKEELLNELIENYRFLISERYDFKKLESQFILDESVTKELTDKVRNYFLEYVYPTPSQRELLNKAFNDLDKHIKNPSYLLKLVGDAPAIIMKFGWQFPKAIKAGFQILKSFNKATKLENDLVKIAKKLKVESPITQDDFELIIANLAEDELRAFITEFEDLLNSLTDSKLLRKTTDILNELVVKMEEDKKYYSKEETDAIRIGIDILENGYQLFDNMSNAEKREMITLIIKAENQFIIDLNEKYS